LTNPRERTIWKELELGLGSGSKFRVTGLRTPSVESQLKTLIELGWVKEYPFTPKTYQINLENKLVTQIHQFLQKLKYFKTGT